MAKKDQPLKDFAKKLVAMSLDDDGQASNERVKAILETVGQNPPGNYKLLLKFYARFLEIEIGRGQAHIEYAGPLTPESITGIEKKFSAEYNRKIVAVTEENTDLIAGVRVTVGDDVYDSSAAARLDQLEMQSSKL